ncbi:hypothetical protein [Paracoccus haeundaensis]|uniref:Uncharacterized protein n=1 Tax=Paracoccus haeundaensis TaxID=225362 RepID=A0A5C4RB86_9RHOB|nr:hypothetical protein [Paracoccus haeundaensis]TNH41263.1 hypothetical protein FHD67_00685 [Paracoccus haeundaensis]
MKTAPDLALDMSYLRAVIDAADFIDNEAAGSDDTRLHGLVTTMIYLAAKMAEDVEAGVYKLADGKWTHAENVQAHQQC